MLTLPPSVHLYVAPQPVDVRKGFNGLSLYVQTQLRLDPLNIKDRSGSIPNNRLIATADRRRPAPGFLVP